jgi:hypothetical protein
MKKDRAKDVSREDIMNGLPVLVDHVDVSGIGRFYVKEMPGAARDEYIAEYRSRPTNEEGEKMTQGMNGMLLCRTVCTKDGSLIFKEDEFELVAEKLGCKTINKLVAKSMIVNGMDPDAVEEAEKN